jgi:MoxR-like ATPase
MESGKPTTEFLKVKASDFISNSDGYVISNVGTIGDSDESASVTLKDWGGGREQWTIADQLSNRHPALSPNNGMPEYEDERLWDGDGHESDNYQTNLVVYLVRCTDGDYYMGYYVGDELPDKWPEPEVTHSPQTTPPHRFGYIEVSSPQNLTKVSKEVFESLEDRKNILLYGPPGTGKTLAMKQLSEGLQNPDNLEKLVLDPSDSDSPFSWESMDSAPIEEPVYTDWVTFHQGTTNEEFVVGLRPAPTEGGVELKARAGTLFEAIRAVESGEYGSAVLFIDEINRANTASVLGEFMTFLEPDKRDLGFRPTSLNANPNDLDQTQKIRFSREIEDRELEDHLGYPVDIPDSLYIVGTMNSLDRSVAPLDQALARRFHRVDVFPDSEILSHKLGVDEERKNYSDLTSLDGAGDTAFHLLSRLNKYIRHSLGREYQFGHGYLEGVWMADNREESWRQLVELWETEFLPQLEEFFRTRREVLEPILLGEEEVPPNGVPYDGQGYPYEMESPPDGSSFQVQDDMLSYEDAAISNLGQKAQREVLAYLALGAGPDEAEIDENTTEET